MPQKIIDIRSSWDGDSKVSFHSTGLDTRLEVTMHGHNTEGMSPEQLFLASVSSSFMQGFLSLAVNAKLRLTDFQCHAVAIYDATPLTPSLDLITLTTTIIVSEPRFITKALILVERAQKSCMVINTVNSKVVLVPYISVFDPAGE